MKIQRFISGAVAGDGGTIVCRVALADGGEVELGLDGRIPKLKKDRVLFIGAYPTQSAARSLARGSDEEKEVIDAVQAYLDEHCSYARREALAETNPADLREEDRSDAMAVDFMRAILDR